MTFGLIVGIGSTYTSVMVGSRVAVTHVRPVFVEKVLAVLKRG